MNFSSSNIEANIEQTSTGSYKVYVIDPTGRRWPYSNADSLETAKLYQKEARLRFRDFGGIKVCSH